MCVGVSSIYGEKIVEEVENEFSVVFILGYPTDGCGKLIENDRTDSQMLTVYNSTIQFLPFDTK